MNLREMLMDGVVYCYDGNFRIYVAAEERHPHSFQFGRQNQIWDEISSIFHSSTGKTPRNKCQKPDTSNTRKKKHNKLN